MTDSDAPNSIFEAKITRPEHLLRDGCKPPVLIGDFWLDNTMPRTGMGRGGTLDYWVGSSFSEG